MSLQLDVFYSMALCFNFCEDWLHDESDAVTLNEDLTNRTFPKKQNYSCNYWPEFLIFPDNLWWRCCILQFDVSTWWSLETVLSVLFLVFPPQICLINAPLEALFAASVPPFCFFNVTLSWSSFNYFTISTDSMRYWEQFHQSRTQETTAEERQRKKRRNFRLVGYCIITMVLSIGAHIVFFR